jgi:cytoskeletal protein RodZ
MAPHKAPGDLGRKLREARERRGLSLRQIASATKISLLTLEALERNDVARLPGGIFSRSFVRSYALEVGLDPEATIQEFMGQFPQDSVTAGHPTTTQIEDHESVESDRRMASTFLGLIFVSIPLAAIVMYFGTAGRRPAVSKAGVQASGVQASEPAAPSSPAVAPPQPTARTGDASAVVPDRVAVPTDAQETARLVVQLKAVQRSWVSAIVDGQRAVQRVFQPGDEQTLDVRRDIVLTAGDAGAITVTLNGAAAKPIGPSGQTATTRLNLTNFKDYLLAP